MKINAAFLGKSLTEIADASGISLSYLSLILSGKRRNVSKATLARIGAVLNLSIEEVQDLIIRQIKPSTPLKVKLVRNIKQEEIIKQTLTLLEHFDIEKLNLIKTKAQELNSLEFKLKQYYLLWIDGILAARNNQFKEALISFDHAYNFKATTSNEKRMLAKVYGGLGSVYIALNDHKMALKMLKKSLRVWCKNNDAALVFLNLGTLYRRTCNYPSAIRAYMLVLEIGQGYIKTLAYSGLGQIYIDINDLPTARGFLLKGYIYSKRLEDKWGTQDLLCNLGMYYKIVGQLKKAEFILNKGIMPNV